jgi:hypothetical protein
MARMDDLRKLEAKGLARAKVRSKRLRAQTIRRRTIRGSLALFAVLWAILFGQLVTGNDPALSRSSHAIAKGLPAKHREPAAPAPITAEVEPEAEAETALEAELEAEREPEFESEVEVAPEPEVEVEVEPEPAPEAPIVTSSS